MRVLQERIDANAYYTAYLTAGSFVIETYPELDEEGTFVVSAIIVYYTLTVSAE